MATEELQPGVGPCDDFYRKLRDGQGVRDITKTLENIYDEWADKYDDEVGSHGYRGHVLALEVLQELLLDRKDAFVIDCGAGTGLAGEQFHAAGYTNVVGVDLSEECLKIASSRNVYKRVAKCAVGRDPLPFNENEADLLITVAAMGPTHIPAESLRDQFRVVKPGGYVVTIERAVHSGRGSEAMVKEYNEKFAGIVDEFKKAGKLEVAEKKVLPNYVGDHPGAVHTFKML